MGVNGDICEESQGTQQEGNGPQGEEEAWEGGHMTSFLL